MVHTVYNVSFPYRLHGLSNHGLVAVLYDSGQLPGPQRFELLLHLSEGKFYGIILWGIYDIVRPLEAQSSHLVLRPLAGVGREVVHEEADLVLPVELPELLQVLLELDDVHRPLVDLEVLLTLLL